jgi:hypothetical protein
MPSRASASERICAASRSSLGRKSGLPNQCSDDSSVAEALAEQWRRGVGAGLPAAPAAPGAARGYRAGPPRPPGARLRGRSDAPLVATRAWDPAGHGHDSTGISGPRDAPPPPDPQAGTRQMRLFEKAEPGESVQVDVKTCGSRAVGRFSTPLWTTARASACCGCTDICITARVSRSSLNSGGPFRSPSSECRATMGRSSLLPSCSGSRPPGSATDTFGPGDRSRTAKSSGAIGSTTRSSGGGTASRTSRRPLKRSEAGRTDTTTNASP